MHILFLTLFSFVSLFGDTPLETSHSIASKQTALSATQATSLDLTKVFLSSPFIYSILLLISIFSIVLWLYTLMTFRSKEMMPAPFVDRLRTHLKEGKLEEAVTLCRSSPNLFSIMILASLSSRMHGVQVMLDTMKAEGKRATTHFWQRLALLNDVAIVAPMLGLLGTVIGMFYAFYDVNRSIESINALFDGLGIAVGTTVAGLIIAILSMILSTTLKYRLVQTLSLVENTALSISTQIKPEKL